MPGIHMSWHFYMDTMLPIHITAVSKTYRSGIFQKINKLAVSDVSLSIESGSVVGIIGRNGAGKSTLIKIILGFIKPDSGDVNIIGKHPYDPESRKHIGYLPENPYFYDNLTAQELISFSAKASGMPSASALHNSERLLKQVGLYEVRKQKLRSYSKGMTQRAGLCFALVHDPEIIILDEPMSGLDPLGRKMVVDLIKDLKADGKTVLFCSHILSDVERICDRIAIMDYGKLKSILIKDEIKSGIEEIFLKIIGEH